MKCVTDFDGSKLILYLQLFYCTADPIVHVGFEKVY